MSSKFQFTRHLLYLLYIIFWGEKWVICNVFFTQSTHTFQKFPNTPMYTIRGYFDTLVVQLSLVPFATNGTYGHDHG
jgi:hypothetical protein